MSSPSPEDRLCELMTPRINEFMPHIPTPKQAAGLLCNHREVFFGGAAGGGKSDWLLMGALQYVDVPGYAALILRETFPQLNAAGGLIPRSHEWLDNTKAEWNGLHSRWAFPSGATLEFGHMALEKHKRNYDGPEFQFVGWDEVTHQTESRYKYLFTRLRRLEGVPIPIRMRSASNPGGPGHDWVKARLVEGSKNHPDRIFIPATIEDNPYIDQEEYEASLSELDDVTKARMMRGDWDVKPEGGLFKRQWFDVVDSGPGKAQRCRGWDFAATAPKPGNDPDYTVGALFAKTDDGEVYVEDIERFRCDPAEVKSRFVQRVRLDGHDVEHALEQEGGSGGKIAASDFVRAVGGYIAVAKTATGSKALRAGPFASYARGGNVHLVNGPWVEAYLDELASFGPDCAHDDQVDGSANGFNKLFDRGTNWADLYPADDEANKSDGFGAFYGDEDFEEEGTWAAV